MAPSALCRSSLAGLLGPRRGTGPAAGTAAKSHQEPQQGSDALPFDRDEICVISRGEAEATQESPKLLDVASRESGATLKLSMRGAALGERLKNVSKPDSKKREHVTLRQLRGSKGALREGFLEDAANAGVSCCLGPFGRSCGAFYAVKGPWMLKFKGSHDGAKAIGVPVPLDGAEVQPVGDIEFEIKNVHIKDHFLGQGLSDMSGGQFVHTVQVCYAAPSQEIRDEWVRALKAQVLKLAEGLARKMAASECPILSPCAGELSTLSTLSTATAVAVNNLASRIFADFEEEEEFDVCARRRFDAYGLPMHPGF